MAAPTERFSAGMPVPLYGIERELKKLWDQSDGAMTRASLINLAVYSETPESLLTNTELISRITENHACRAIVIGADPRANTERIDAWISAHCHVSRGGNKQICSEQLSFRLEGACPGVLASIVFSHLDSDLPFYLWWQSELREPMDPQLWGLVDRLIYDSQLWNDFDSQMRLIEIAREETKQRIVLCDLNWTRLVRLRLALAQFFDDPRSHHHFDEIDRVRIEFAPSFRSTAVLLAGWLAAQLSWRLEKNQRGNAFQFVNSSNQNIAVELREEAGEPIGRATVHSDELSFSVLHPVGADLLEVFREKRGDKQGCQLIPALSNDPVELLTEELIRGGPRRVYLRAVERVRDLL